MPVMVPLAVFCRTRQPPPVFRARAGWYIMEEVVSAMKGAAPALVPFVGCGRLKLGIPTRFFSAKIKAVLGEDRFFPLLHFLPPLA